MKKIIIGSFLLAAIALSCKKTNTIPVRTTPTPAAQTNVKFFNFSPGAPQVNFFINGTKLSGAAPLANGTVQGIAYGRFFPANVAYASVPAGGQQIETRVIDSSTVMPGATLLSEMKTFDAGKYYTYILLDSVNRISAMVTEDDLSVPDPTMAYIRIGNFATDSTISALLTKTTVPTGDFAYSKPYNNIAPKSVTAFDTLKAGSGQVYSLTFRRSTNGATLGTVVTEVTPIPGKKYTFFFGGLVRLSATYSRGVIANN
ncbi:DUF4397 domain-containing protein [Flaviaesturariibacter amylovorans]|uniref:DUF4397 domain-containing protein n=1 Tax=Flaviaesturariibacter amylovorans TaxID=1084520 RepID=A0ABP8HSG9_9BACT